MFLSDSSKEVQSPSVFKDGGVSINTIDSRFEVLLGDVTLGQRGDLLQHAARPGEQVTVGVLQEESQTAIVEAGAQIVLNFNYFWRQVSRRFPAEQLIVTLRRLLLDPSTGATLAGSEEELSPSKGRISVNVGGDGQQHFVSIADATLNDSGVYSIEVCSQSGTPDELCERSSITLFVLSRECLVLNYLIIHTLFYSQWDHSLLCAAVL